MSRDKSQETPGKYATPAAQSAAVENSLAAIEAATANLPEAIRLAIIALVKAAAAH
jgi:hypothetical protein